MSRVAPLFLLALLLSGPVRAAQEPQTTINVFHAALSDTMEKGATLGCKGRIDKLDPVIGATFDMDFVAGHILRRRWEKMTLEQRSAFALMLKNLTVLAYASNFSKAGPTFTTLESRSVSATRTQVRTRLTPAHDEPVSLDYFLQRSGDDWRIINVIANGVSDLALRSSQYDKVFGEHGFDGLMEKLRKQAAADLVAC